MLMTLKMLDHTLCVVCVQILFGLVSSWVVQRLVRTVVFCIDVTTTTLNFYVEILDDWFFWVQGLGG